MTHLKTIAAPRSMKIKRNETIFTLTPSPGPHAKSECITLGMLLRDYMALAENRKEVRHILNNKEVLVDGRRVKSENFPLGLMDVIAIPEHEKPFIMLVDHRGRLYPKEIDKKHAEHKLAKLAGKTMVASGKLQLNLYDGRNILVDGKEAAKYKVGGTAVIKLPDGKITEFMPLEVGKVALIAKGRHAGKKGKILEISKSDLNLRSLTTLDCDGEKVITNTEYVYIIGDKL